MPPLSQEAAALRPVISFGLLFLLAGAEALWPRRPRALSRWGRWPGNLGIAALGALAVKLAFPVAALGVAALAARACWGVLNLASMPEGLKIVTAVLALDFAIYIQHRVFHAVPVLWRLHRMHHADLDLDVTSGARFHPLEIMLSMLIKMGVVLLIGAPPLAVLLFEIILNATAMFNHSNLALPPALDGVLRLVLVTPDMHRVHHSVIRAETDSNFGFNVPWWDRLFATYRAQPAQGQLGMMIGLPAFRKPGASRLDALLVQPFLTPDDGAA
ncbi:sterol desaturase family protein [Acidocella sp. KAb 2-4]|uniref:sterol desaturase family protein n=1 Tax=Acidocella sp. KAb 2-4 TaxID=2885158 RepID=UPI001D07FB99|nr:sterol desaturase family protein [Acidocella sp. KAb 2-4]MCB5944666.1 sterol desaturase family protein [Acidocella sp. KAb 2-4]